MAPSKKIKCKDCLRHFKSMRCFFNHKEWPGSSFTDRNRIKICDQIKICKNCLCHYRAKRTKNEQTHQCGEVSCKHKWAVERFILLRLFKILCPVCFTHAMSDHKCFIKTLKFDDEKRVEHETARFMFFDFETYVGPTDSYVLISQSRNTTLGRSLFSLPTVLLAQTKRTNSVSSFFKKNMSIFMSLPTISNRLTECLSSDGF